MKTPVVAFGDLHLRSKAPEMRIDDYLQEQKRKLEYSFVEIPKNSLVAFPGDVFNSSREPYWLIEMFMELLNSRRDLYYLFIPGQHDQRYHNLDLHNTPIGLLQAGVRNSMLANAGGSFIRGFLIYGRHYGAETPKPCENSEKKQILIAHKMLVKDDDLYPGQNAILSNTFMRNYPYDIIISGDNHEQFIERTKNRLLVNMGSFMRMKTDQKKHKPAICIIDNDLETNIVQIPINPANEVFAKKDSNVKKLVQTIGKDFIHGIKEDEHKGITFLDRLNRKLRREDDEVKDVMGHCLQQIGE
jgi:hypothetical protein